MNNNNDNNINFPLKNLLLILIDEGINIDMTDKFGDN
jgi:hypothetical protein